MKTYLLKVFSFTAIFTFLFSTFAFGQTEQNSQAEAQINDLTNKSGAYFRSGINALQDGMRQQAGDNFDKSLEVFLYSTINVQRNQKLSDCYNQLVETIYRIEFPTNQQPPNIRSLSATCGWNITNEAADNVAKLVLTVPTTETNTNNSFVTAAVTNNSTQGFQTQEFKPSPLDELSKLELTQEKQKGETWENISARTGVSVQDLRAANGNAAVPGSKVIIPQKGNIVNNVIYSRPTNQPTTTTANSNVRIVKAQSGDTVTTLASREKVSVDEVATFNGLLPTTKLVAGREIRIPLSLYNKSNQTSQNSNVTEAQKKLGTKPAQGQDGKVKVVMEYFNETLNDPYSMRFVRWSKVIEKTYRGINSWSVQVKYRAKNALGAYILTEQIFYIKNNKVVAVEKLY